MPAVNAWKYGAVLCVTVVIGYALCLLFWYAFPNTSLNLLNGLFHGIDFRKISTEPVFSIGTFLAVLLVLAVWSYAIGLIYAAVRNAILLPDKG
jgi:hypothetical protein